MDHPIFGIAGNSPGHMQAAGEMGSGAEDPKPEGIFAIFLPGDASYLGVNPVSSGEIAFPSKEQGTNVQSEAEVLVKTKLSYFKRNNKLGELRQVEMESYTLCDDVSIRKGAATKLSPRKNWGEKSMIIAEEFRDDFSNLSKTPITSSITRDGMTHKYGLPLFVHQYKLFGEELCAWIVETVTNQRETEKFSPLADYFKAHQPEYAYFAVGGGDYSEFALENFLQPGDQMQLEMGELSIEYKII
ncbi:MAG: DUF5718 family protein [Candidatus Dojkabacteria bacterium]